jgi:NAD(P)-dependent dehydrogenase (short-subunit alcohol dehydrogenase family)
MPTVLITGAGRGLGLEFVKQYAAAGYRVFATARKPESARELVALQKQHANVSLHTLEVSEPASLSALVAQLSGEPIDILINNAGVMGPERQQLGSLDYDGMLQTLISNAIAPLRIAEALLENVAKSQRKLITAITSGMGSIADSSGGYYAYRASKAALNMNFRNLARDLAPRGITTIVINPGWVKTDMGGAGAKLSPAESIGGMRKVFDAVKLEDSGRFMNHDGGELTW